MQGMFELTLNIEEQQIKLERARAVLSKVIESFMGNIEPESLKAQLLVRDTERIFSLLNVADSLILETLPELSAVVDALAEKSKLLQQVHGGVK